MQETMYMQTKKDQLNHLNLKLFSTYHDKFQASFILLKHTLQYILRLNDEKQLVDNQN